jgi:hypothetical protein
MKRTIIAVLAYPALVGGPLKLDGTSVAKGDGIFRQTLEFVLGDAVSITMLEQTVHGTCEVDGERALLIVDGQRQVFKIDGAGGLDGGAIFGTLCKDLNPYIANGKPEIDATT